MTRPRESVMHKRSYSEDEATKEIEKLRAWRCGLAFVVGAQASYISLGWFLYLSNED
jgi:hypothetical protein